MSQIYRTGKLSPDVSNLAAVSLVLKITGSQDQASGFKLYDGGQVLHPSSLDD